MIGCNNIYFLNVLIHVCSKMYMSAVSDVTWNYYSVQVVKLAGVGCTMSTLYDHTPPALLPAAFLLLTNSK